MSAEWGPEWDRVVDVIVVGCGAAGATAAVVAAAAGSEVEILERASHPGGTTAKSHGRMWIPNHPYLRADGVEDNRADALIYMAWSAYPLLFDAQSATLGLPQDRYAMLEAYYDHASQAIEHLEKIGALQTQPVTFADYYATAPAGVTPNGRTIEPRWTGTSADDYTGGQFLMDQLVSAAQSYGVRLSVDHRAMSVVRSGEQVVGVFARTGRRSLMVGARRGVIFTSGGFAHDPRLTVDYLRGPIFGGGAVAEATGDFVRIGLEVGAQLGNMANAWWAQEALEHTVRERSTVHDAFFPFGDSMLMVDRFGRRVVNEKAPYNERTQVHFQWDPTANEYPNLLLFMIFDDAVLQHKNRSKHRWPIPRPDEPADHVISGDDLAELATRLEARVAGLARHTGGARLDGDFLPNFRRTLADFNAYAANGHDPDFRRGETPLEKALDPTPRSGAASGSMHPLSQTGPYHAVILVPGAIDTKGGPVTNEHSQVLSTSGTPIPGLYGAGNCIASPAAQAYWGPGGTIGPAIAFGYLAAVHAAGSAPRSPRQDLTVGQSAG